MKRAFFRSAGIVVGIGLVVCCLSGCFKKNPQNPEQPVFNEDLYNLRITEIHYNPEDDNGFSGDSLEFLEIKNIGDKDLELKTLKIVDGLSYVFPEDATLESGAYLVLASSAATFEQYYGFAPDGDYDGALKNSGETITISDMETNEVVLTQFYADTGSWPSETDGKGYSLVAVKEDEKRETTGSEVWRRSVRTGGSPGAADTKEEVDARVFDLRVTEIQYNPLDHNGIDGDSLEFIELKNVGDETIDLTDIGFTNGISYDFPEGTTIEAGAFIVLASETTSFKDRYSSVTPMGTYEGNLSNTGETITLKDLGADTVILKIKYNDGGSWPEIADGVGHSLVPTKSNPAADQNNPAVWRPSLRIGGSPGADDPGIAIVTEVLTHTDEPDLDAIELYNPGSEKVDLSGWLLTDDRNNPKKFRIPKGTEIPAGGYLYFDETDFNADSTDESSFTLNSHGEEVYLVADSLVGCMGGYCDGFKFGELENGVSFGRYITASGKIVYTALKDQTLGEENTGPLVGPLVITEIMYHSEIKVGDYLTEENTADYLEITNISGKEVKLYHEDNPELTWKVKGIKFSFPANMTIKSKESVVIASDSIDITTFRTRYGVDESVQIFSMNGALSNGSEKLELMKPEDPYLPDTTADSTEMVYPYMVFDEVKYEDSSPWPEGADGGGKALHRTSGTVYGNDPQSWIADDPSPGSFGD